MSETVLNVLGTPLECCCTNPVTGFYRDGYCRTGIHDQGRHLVCARVTDDFLAYSRSHGNDLITPRPDCDFPGLKDGDHWCLCAERWKDALAAGVAPPVLLAATHRDALNFVTIEALRIYSSTPPAGGQSEDII